MSILHEWAKLLGGEVSGNSVLAPGPGHSARDRSLSVTPSATAPDGFVVHSFSGDDPIVCKDYVRAKLGLPAFSPKRSQKPAAATSNGDAKRVLINTLIYTYRNPQGEKIYCKERYEYSDGSKSFAIKPAGRNGSSPLLYGCERLADLGAGDPVWIVEGEKKVERLRQLGATAVCCDSGANSKWLPQHAEVLRGLPIILWPDSDDAGIQYAASAAAAIHERDPVSDIRVVCPFPIDGRKGRDVIDWATAGGTSEQLHALIENDARPWTPSGPRDPPQSREQGKPNGKIEHFEIASPDDQPPNLGEGQPQQALTWSEDELALAFAAEHAETLQYIDAWSRWHQWTTARWEHENTLAAFDLARKLIRRG